MGDIPFDCPHLGCRTKNVAFKALGSFSSDGVLHQLFGICMACERGVVMAISGRHSRSLPEALNNIEFEKCFSILQIYPKPPEPTVIEALPDNVQRSFESAEANLVDNRLGGAAMLYRQTLERAVKAIHPDGKGNLYDRIEALGREKGVPKALLEMMHTIRILGNAGAHDEDPTLEEVLELHDFTHLFLTYSFELPARVKAVLDARGKSTP